MKLPKRHPTHIIESKSWKVLQAKLPSHWILREVTERDYGVDAYIELVTTEGEVTGELVSIQLKGKEGGNIDWKTSSEKKHFAFTGTKVTTVQYWMNIPVPVFLFVADVDNSQLWFADVKDQTRRNYDAYRSQSTLTFSVCDADEIGPMEGFTRFLRAYARERNHSRFSTDIVTLLSNAEQFAEFLAEHLMRDCFLTLEPDEILSFSLLLETTSSVARHLDVPWEIKSFNDICEEDRDVWQNDGKGWYVYGEIHEGTVAKYVQLLAPKLVELLAASRTHIVETHTEYWSRVNPVLHSVLEIYDYKHIVHQLDGLIS